MIKFGPSGNSAEFYDEGYKSTFQAMAWIANKGLNAYEYSFGRGVRMGEDAAKKIAQEARKYNISLSVHAPFYINLASDDDEKLEKNYMYFKQSAIASKLLGASRVIFHPGSCAKVDRAWAVDMTKRNLLSILNMLTQDGLTEEITYCPETMGKINQVGSLEEIIELCNIDERLLPTIDFGHLHTRGLGAINTSADFEEIIIKLINGIGYDRTSRMHVHFSKIAYTKMGEKAHVTFDDEGYGPDFTMLAPIIKKYKLYPTIICESKDTMAKDAVTMLRMYNEVNDEQA